MTGFVVQGHMLLDFDVREQQEVDFFTGGSVL